MATSPGLVNRLQPGGGAGVHQILGQFGLAVDHHLLAAGQAVHIDPVKLAADQQFDALVLQAFGMHAGADSGLVQQIDRHLFEHAGADASQHVFGCPVLEDDGVDPRFMQQLPENKPGRAGTDYCDLYSHLGSPFK